jgi:hypothetical protein
MPAFQLLKIKSQVADLGLSIPFPGEFQKGLRNLLERYGSTFYRSSQSAGPAGLIPAYHVPPMVLHQIEQELEARCQADPATALQLADMLWKDPFLEPRLLAASILGQLPRESMDTVLDRLQKWLQPNLGSQLLRPALDLCTRSLRYSAPNQWIGVIENWLKNPSIPHQMMGLKALLVLSEDRQFENIPAVFRLLNQVVKTSHPPLQNDLFDVLSELSQRTPTETAVFLRQVLSSTPTSNLARLVRRLLPRFASEHQASLQEILRTIQ